MRLLFTALACLISVSVYSQEEVNPNNSYDPENWDYDKPFRSAQYMPVLGPCNDEPDENKRIKCTQMEISKYVSENMKYPITAIERGIQGTVYVDFVVGKDGYVRDVKILRGVDPRLDKEAERLIESLPRFQPGLMRGKIVSVQYTIPLKFILQ